MSLKVGIVSTFFSKAGLLAGFLLIVPLWFGCGASRQTAQNNGEPIDIDELLGEKEATQATRDSDESEVLRLLGIQPAEEKTAMAQTTEPASQPEGEELKASVESLKQQLQEKDREISELRSEITQKEVRISDLQSRVAGRSQSPVRPAGTASEPSPEFKARYQRALNLFKARNYQQALQEFKALLVMDPNTSLSDNCQYWIGECYYGMGNYDQAIVEFEKVFSFPNSNKSDDA
ncbi:MAG: hypothetical protein D6743_15750, partial [Calditrichaeota bacterium]